MWWNKKSSQQHGWAKNQSTTTQSHPMCGASATVSYAYIMSDYQIKVSQRKAKLNKIFKKEKDE